MYHEHWFLRSRYWLVRLAVLGMVVVIIMVGAIMVMLIMVVITTMVAGVVVGVEYPLVFLLEVTMVPATMAAVTFKYAIIMAIVGYNNNVINQQCLVSEAENNHILPRFFFV